MAYVSFVFISSYLHVSGDSFGRPIHGQREVSAYASPNDQNYWKVQEGVYITPTDFASLVHYRHDELWYCCQSMYPVCGLGSLLRLLFVFLYSRDFVFVFTDWKGVSKIYLYMSLQSQTLAVSDSNVQMC